MIGLGMAWNGLGVVFEQTWDELSWSGLGIGLGWTCDRVGMDLGWARHGHHGKELGWIRNGHGMGGFSRLAGS